MGGGLADGTLPAVRKRLTTSPMQTSEPAPDVQKLLRDHIESYEQLELLLLLSADREASWTEEALSARLRIGSTLVRAALGKLQSAGFVAARMHGNEKRYEYLLQNESIEATVSRLAAEYREYPIPIIKLMSANAIERLRTSALHTFADAFILRKDKNRG
jgi:predicted transcriptional regulator